MPANNRSRLGNGSALPSGIDGRTGPARRWKECFYYYMSETGGRHEQIIRGLASLIVARERLDAAMAKGEAVDVLALVRLAGQIQRCLRALGLVTVDDEPAPDATEQVLARIRAHRVDTVTA